MCSFQWPVSFQGSNYFCGSVRIGGYGGRVGEATVVAFCSQCEDVANCGGVG